MADGDTSPRQGEEIPRLPRDLLVAGFGEEGGLAFRLSVRVPVLLNPTALDILEDLRQGAGLEETASRLASRFELDAPSADKDVRALVRALEQEGLLGRGREPEGTPPLPHDWNQMQEETMAEPETGPGPEPETTPPPDIPEEAVPRRTSAEVVLREEEEGAFLFEPETGELSVLNPVGIRVWKLVKERKTLRDIVDAVVADYEDVERDTVHKDVRAFLGELKTFGYVKWES